MSDDKGMTRDTLGNVGGVYMVVGVYKDGPREVGPLGTSLSLIGATAEASYWFLRLT